MNADGKPQQSPTSPPAAAALTPAVVASFASVPLACDWLLAQSSAMISYHQQQLHYWNAVKKELTVGAAYAAAAASSHPPHQSSPSSKLQQQQSATTPTAADKRSLFMDAAGTKLAAVPAAVSSNRQLQLRQRILGCGSDD